MKTIGTCSICGGAVQIPDNDTAALPKATAIVPKCAQCGSEAESSFGPTIKMKAQAMSSLDELRNTLEAVVDRWCPKINPNSKTPSNDSFEQRMSKALLAVNAFEIDYRRVIAGGKAINTEYPLPLPERDHPLVT